MVYLGQFVWQGLLAERRQEEGIVRGSVDAPAGFQLRIELREVLPPVWRRFLVGERSCPPEDDENRD
jgi:hypothetical protein